MPDSAISPDPVLIVGAVTWDIIDGRRIPGGAVTYAARTATALGVRAYILISAGEDSDLAAFAGHEVAVVGSESTMTLEHRGVRGALRQRVLAAPTRSLSRADLSAHWPSPRTIVLGTLLPGDIDVSGFLDLQASESIVIAQGMQRAVADDGTVDEFPAPSVALTNAARLEVTLCLSADETAKWHPATLASLVFRARRVVHTLGAVGAEIHASGSVHSIAALAAEVVDPTGAGDVFATALILTMRAGEDVAGRLAAACAAACVERPGSAPLPSRTDLEERAGIRPPAGDDRTQGEDR